jgi:hypothetical protein
MSSVAGAVVTIDGDSSGLVGALQKGEKGIAGVKTEARKLSDQLREVADDADKSAGALVQKVGGPGAVKAIAGVGAAFAIAKAGVDLFLDSSEKLFRSYGEKGQVIWDDLEKSLFDIQGAFAKAALQTDDMYVAGGRLYALLELVKGMAVQAADSTILAINLMRKIPGTAAWILQKQGFFEAFDRMAKEGEERSKELVKNMEKSAVAFAKPLTAAKTLTETVDAMATAYAGLRASSVSVQDQNRAAALENIDNTVKQVEALALLQNMADNMSGDNVGGLTDKQIEDLDRLGKLRQEIVDGAKQPAATVTPTGGGPKADATGVKEAADDTVYAFALAEGGYAELTKSQADFLLASETMLGDSSSRVFEMKRAEFDNMAALGDSMYLHDIDAQTKRDEADAERRAARAAAIKTEEELVLQGKLDRMMEEMEAIQKAKEKEIADDKAAKALMFNLAVIQSGKMLANAIVGNKKMSEVARAAMGNVASGLGDIAMVKSAEYAADGLWPQASGMAVAGTLGYTIAAALGADKKANAGPPTERAQPVQNYAYNLRIDSAFADSESISRRFAQMQEGARQRGLITAAA